MITMWSPSVVKGVALVNHINHHYYVGLISSYSYDSFLYSPSRLPSAPAAHFKTLWIKPYFWGRKTLYFCLVGSIDLKMSYLIQGKGLCRIFSVFKWTKIYHRGKKIIRIKMQFKLIGFWFKSTFVALNWMMLFHSFLFFWLQKSKELIFSACLARTGSGLLCTTIQAEESLVLTSGRDPTSCHSSEIIAVVLRDIWIFNSRSIHFPLISAETWQGPQYAPPSLYPFLVLSKRCKINQTGWNMTGCQGSLPNSRASV